jgi:hypothetical protein
MAQRRSEATTSSLVTGAPSWKRRLSRREKFQVRPSGLVLWLATICGCGRIFESSAKSVS